MRITERTRRVGGTWSPWCMPYEANEGQPQTALLRAGWVKVTITNRGGLKRQFRSCAAPTNPKEARA